MGDQASSAMRSPMMYCVAAPSEARSRTRNGDADDPRNATRAVTNVPSVDEVMLLTEVMPRVAPAAMLPTETRGSPMMRATVVTVRF